MSDFPTTAGVQASACCDSVDSDPASGTSELNSLKAGLQPAVLNPETRTLKPVGEADPIGTTSNHPFWSVDRQEYVQAGQLRVGERLQTLHGDTKIVVSNLPRPGPKTNVYNLEVHAEHTYFVGQDGVLVHNSQQYTINQLKGRFGSYKKNGGTLTWAQYQARNSHRIRKPVIIGETMTRVEAAAAKTSGGAKILNDMPEYWNMGLESYEVTSKMMAYNRKWLHQQLKDGRRIIDIGIDPNRKIPSIFYQMEQSMLKNFEQLHPGTVNRSVR